MLDNIKQKPKKKEILFGDEEDEYLEEDNYFKIDGKNTFSIGDVEESKDKLYKILNDNDDFIIDNLELQKKILSLFYEKLFKTDSDPFNICHALSKQLIKSLNINNKIIDEKLDYFINKKKDYKYSKKIEFDKENVTYLGYILAYAYDKFSKYKISNGKDLKEKVDKTKEEIIDILILYLTDCNKKNLPKEKCSKTLFCKKNRSNFQIPGTYIFLLNSFTYINTIEINFNFEEEKLTKDDVNLLIISILNIQYLFHSKINVKINLIHEELQCLLYRRFYKELYKNTPKGNFKMIFMNKLDVYKKKWDFETEFLLEKHRNNKRNIFEKEFEQKFNSETLLDENISLNNNSYNFIYKTPTIEELLSNINDNSNNNSSTNYNIYKSQKIVLNKNKNNVSMFNLKDDSNNNFNSSTMSKSNNLVKSFSSNKSINSSNFLYKLENNPNKNIENLHYDNIIEKYKKSLQLILLTTDSLCHFTNMKRLDLILNDCYQSELQYYLNNYCTTEDVNNKIYIIDILINKVRKLEEFNIELNILDHITFNKILSFINYNPSLTSIKMSFFSSDATYLRQTIYKIYYQNLGSKSISISEIIDMILPHFVQSLEILFELIKIKDFKKIAVNFDTPSIIEVNNSYMNTIFKFIMNLIFLVDNPNSQIEKLVILSPCTKFDSRFLPSIDNILEDINFNLNNKFLNELSLHLQLSIIKNIHNLITERLILLNIGDCDVFTFNELTKFLASYKFCKISSLKKISISLLNSIIEYTDKIKNIFYKIFTIKIKQLTELNIYTNIYINKDSYIELTDIFKNNWISKCRLVLNPRSEIEINDSNEGINNNIIYLVSRNLEDKLLSSDELVIRNKIFFDKDKKNKIVNDKDDNIFWLSKRLFYIKNKDKKPTLQKYIKEKDFIFNILKYAYFTKKVEINYQLDS